MKSMRAMLILALVCGSATACAKGGNERQVPSGPPSIRGSACDSSLPGLPSLPGTPARILNPAPDATVGQAFEIAAEIDDVPSGRQVWIVVQLVGPRDNAIYSAGDCLVRTRLWPGPHALTATDRGYTGFGFCAGRPAEHTGLRCRVTIVAADTTASSTFTAYNTLANTTHDYPGIALSELRGDVRQLASVVVTRGRAEVPASPCKTNGLPLPALTGTTGSFVTPADRSPVNQAFPVKARITDVPPGYQPWTLLQVTGPTGHPSFQRNECVASTRVWPSSKALQQSDDTLAGTAFCGANSILDVGLECRLLLILADADAVAGFSSYNERAADRGYPGLGVHELPDGIRRLAEITVVRKPMTVPVPTPPVPSPPSSCATPALKLAASPINGSILTPTNQSLIAQAFVIKAQAGTLPSGYQLWTLLQITGPPGHPTYLSFGCVAATRIWPGPNALQGKGDYFEGYGFCAGGSSQDAGLTCRLTVVLADQAASAKFTSYNNSASANGFPGLAARDLTGTIYQVATVSLTRQ